MGAKAKKDGGSGVRDNIPPIVQKDLLQRVNFSHQASIYLQNLSESSRQHERSKQTGSNHRKAPRTATSGFASLARSQMRNVKKISEHNTLKLDVTAKRAVCSECNAVLVPGLTSRIRNRPNRNHINVVNQTCLQCENVTKRPCPPVSEAGTSMDGPSRKCRRIKAASRNKTAFFDREGPAGHTLWLGVDKVHGWGQTTIGSDTEASIANTS
ncbi:hypothetical protein BD324DRAFT_652390 [Kockovaella imperatae]|uniref:RNAse P Rpr2/Rpp21/SNM1 subunit domain-domain-containing protein n=1 Tax=Kockovaella imperatae TaxID=4999 RepID=A0A1Y1UB41_9TREE|nr:hypothetical protein BD324DRAFT_652390 [Kockovaella imperatae]ORX35251.1 hypothetical protein BD324DRAFT_652390 [Kockovaella imperatae]